MFQLRDKLKHMPVKYFALVLPVICYMSLEGQ
jgi:hypothetical protein